MHRIQVPLTDETRKALDNYANASGHSLAKTCGMLLEQAAPSLGELAAAMERAQQVPGKAVRDMAKILQNQIDQTQQGVLDLSPKATQRKRKKA